MRGTRIVLIIYVAGIVGDLAYAITVGILGR
jgi:hypothetical protein